ncbi:F-box only protein 40 [Apodemus speciosus]|uniref:F-box only protein 40 n=1 Tax=Apodemus speciosus TaxID=105296 RepID=A0ABQ0FLY4_APOSI
MCQPQEQARESLVSTFRAPTTGQTLLKICTPLLLASQSYSK